MGSKALPHVFHMLPYVPRRSDQESLVDPDYFSRQCTEIDESRNATLITVYYTCVKHSLGRLTEVFEQPVLFLFFLPMIHEGVLYNLSSGKSNHRSLFAGRSLHYRTCCICRHLGHGQITNFHIYIHIHNHTYIYMYIYIYIFQYIYLSTYPSIHPSIYLSVCLSGYLSIYLSFYLSICLTIKLSNYLSIYLPHIYLSISYISIHIMHIYLHYIYMFVN